MTPGHNTRTKQMTKTNETSLTTTKPVWFITGCSTGFGRELAKHVLELGYRAVVTARYPEDVKDLSASGGQMRRFTRLTNAFSKKIDNHVHQVALFYMWYNFARVHQTLRVTPAMEAGLSSHVWSIQEIVNLTASA